MKPRTREHGFTLVELLVVLAILGILAGLAAALLDPRPRADDAAQAVAALARETGREAVSRGEVRDDVSPTAGTARSRLVVSATANQSVDISVQVLVEQALPSANYDWVEVGHDSVGPGVTFNGSTAHAQIDDGTTPDVAYSAPVTIECYASGVCDGATLYFTGSHTQKSRVILLPLGGAPMTFLQW